MVDMRCQIQIDSTRRLMALDEIVAAHGVTCGINVGEKLRGCKSLGVQDGVCGDVIVSQQVLLGLGVEIVERSPCVCEGCCAACSWWGELVREEEGVACAAGVEARVYVEEVVSL